MSVFDVHAHFTVETSEISEDAQKIGYAVHNKSIEQHLAFMDRVGIGYTVLTCPTQKFLDDKEKCVAYCREVNNKGSKIIRSYSDRFGFAAALPLPYVDEAIEELKRDVDLGACAVSFCSNYNGMYMGDPALEPLFNLINEIGCPIIVHPAAPLVYPENPITGKILPMYEFITDTTRTLLDLFASEVLNRYPNVKVVVPHSGSCLPVALDRFYGITRVSGKNYKVPMHQLYFDLACDAFPHGVPVLLTMTDKNHILYGSNFPAIPEPVLEMHMKNARECPELTDHVEDVLWNNAAALFGKGKK